MSQDHKIKIALLQIAPESTLEANLEKGLRCCKEAKRKEADIALFPEMWSNGYHIYGRPVSEWQAEALSVDSDFVNAFGRLARELDMAIGITLLEKCETAPAIQLFSLTASESGNLYMPKCIPATLAPSMILHPARIFMSQPLTQRAVRWRLAL